MDFARMLPRFSAIAATAGAMLRLFSPLAGWREGLPADAGLIDARLDSAAPLT
jgi:hypothetical protein